MHFLSSDLCLHTQSDHVFKFVNRSHSAMLFQPGNIPKITLNKVLLLNLDTFNTFKKDGISPV